MPIPQLDPSRNEKNSTWLTSHANQQQLNQQKLSREFTENNFSSENGTGKQYMRYIICYAQPE